MTRVPIKRIRMLPVAALYGLLAACNASFVSDFGSNFSIGGTLSGLPGGQSIVLLNNGRDSLTVAANGRFVFGGLVPFNGSYLVTISTQPASANCTVTNASGTATNDVNNVQVTCVPR
ncbi:DUF4369 domain-containing protein [Ralstonia insidiosa]|uniref:Uncharacterized protein n=1 Tax=Ralstonia insidiosa TaxID=190721 RepID=A0A192A1L1_9RALS|nr:DUF4369 domain-containing protein [Ralstonia insidiosa]ANJ74223.1 hypothetical protein A9Y76_17965 [Ralstonia insidiosa]KAB0471439.1 hypothetical protein F7R11_02215 [Ralstonia insidiosa]MBY4909030.1 DUF4369 domain-containing protein [Ralstonia insidiosa]